MPTPRREQSGPQPQITDDTRNKWIRRAGLAAFGVGAIYLAQEGGEKPEPQQPPRAAAPQHETGPVRPVRTHTEVDELPDIAATPETQTYNLGDIPLVREGFDAYDENRLSWDSWKSEEAKRQTLAIYKDLLARMVVDQSDDAIHIYIPGSADPEILITSQEVNGGVGLVLSEYGRPVFQTPEMDLEGSATRIESFVSDAVMHEAKHLYAEINGTQPTEGILDEYDHDRASSMVEVPEEGDKE